MPAVSGKPSFQAIYTAHIMNTAFTFTAFTITVPIRMPVRAA